MQPLRQSSPGPDTVHGVLRRRARSHPGRPFLSFLDESGAVTTVSYGEMDRRAERMADLLVSRGIGPGSRFHVHLTNRPEFFDAWFGAAKAGAVMVPTNPLSTADELSYVLSHAECRLSLTQPELLTTAQVAAIDSPCCEQLLVTGSESLERALATAPARPARVVDDPAAPLGVLYTSGTTSRPKGVVVPHAAYLHSGEVVARQLRLRQEDRQLIVLPLFHGNAQYYSSMSALVTGASIALAPRFSASRWSEQAVRLGATVASLFAAPIRMILAQRPSAYDTAHRLRSVLFAQNVTDAQLAEFEERFGVPLLQLYGMTETVAPPLMNPLHGRRRNQSMGRPVPGARLRIVDERLRDVVRGQSGELLVGGVPGRTLMAGYLGDPEATAEALGGGWLRTGDHVRVDGDGFVHFVDRGKDVIKRAGENVSSSEIERVVNAHPAVFESAVVGVPDPIRDETVKVFVVLNGQHPFSEGELIEWCAARLAPFKVPGCVAVVEGLPRTSVGKIRKHLLRGR
ncbi:AMP-binding protein [Streptomyces catenulae]|uniref:AMP-binding protein n=1 Tax=Streptomyces catenulae TaxID=66875 RepID=A0ABV2Z833_9ACTN|nr:AMP-binding protein [Streptomyces catenulae]